MCVGFLNRKQWGASHVILWVLHESAIVTLSTTCALAGLCKCTGLVSLPSHLLTLAWPVLQFREVRDDYPVWARFLFGFITGSLMLIIPVYLVGKLSLDTKARMEARDWCIDLLLGTRNRLLAVMYCCTWLFTCQCCRQSRRTADRHRLHWLCVCVRACMYRLHEFTC